MKFRTFITPLAVGGGLVFLVGMALLTGLLLRNPLTLIDKGGLQSPAAFQFVPKQSALVASVLTRPDRLTDLWEYLTAPELRQQTRRDIEQIEQTILAGTGLTYEQDILPWLGNEITVAVFDGDVDQDPSNGVEPGYFVALSCQDAEAARVTLELFWQNRAIAGDALVFEDFAGNRLIYSNRSSPNRSDVEPSLFLDRKLFQMSNLVTTLVANQFLLVANHPEVMRQALTAAQSADNNLASDYRYERALKVLPQPRVGLLAMSLSSAAEVVPGFSTQVSADSKLQTGAVGSGRTLGWGLISLGLTRQGIVGDVALTPAPGRQFEPRQAVLTDLPETVRYLPETLTLAAVGQKLPSLWLDFSSLLQRFNQSPKVDLGFGEDWTPALKPRLSPQQREAMAGNFALGFDLMQKPNWLMVSDWNENWPGVLTQVESMARAQAIGINTLPVRGVVTTALARLSLQPDAEINLLQSPRKVSAEILGLQTRLDDMNVMASTPGLMEAAIRHWQEDTPSGPAWTEDLALFEQPNEGYIHITWPKLQAGLSQQIARFRLWETTAKPILRHLRTVTLTSYGRSQDLQTGRFFLKLGN